MRPLIRIGMDIDGVIANFGRAFHRQVLRPLFGIKGEFKEPDEFNYGLDPEQMKRALSHIDQLRGFWADLEPYPKNLDATVQFIQTMPKDWQLLFITRRHGDPRKTWEETLLWLEKYRLMVPYKTRLLMCPADGPITKGYLCATEGVSFLLDDNPDNLDDVFRLRGFWAELQLEKHRLLVPYKEVRKTTPVLLARPWNRDSRSRFIVVKSVQQYFNLVRRALTKGESHV
jgi:hypothetical protein